MADVKVDESLHWLAQRQRSRSLTLYRNRAYIEWCYTEMKTILAVDDSPSIRQMVAFTLSGAGYTVVQAVDGVDGLAKAQTTNADLVLTDQNMPNADGLTLIRGLRGLPKYAKTPILVLTTEAGDDMKNKGKAAGATGWIVKPFDPVTLLAVVKKVLG